MDFGHERFEQARLAAEYDMGCKGIGTMREKSLHLVLKHYFAPDTACHELPVGGFIADAVTEEGVVEIQTRNLSRLREKLRAFLEVCNVTVVYPIASTKWLYTVDENGELLGKRKSPKHDTIFTQMRDIYSLRDFTADTRFRLRIVELELAEYRIQSDKPRRKFHGNYEKLDRVPLDIQNIVTLESPADWLSLLPSDLPQTFSVREAAKYSGESESNIRMLLKLLEQMNAAEQCEKQGNAVVWRIAEPFRASVLDTIGG
ncbi:MAG: hypothetical protein MJ062_04675 [Oscillospiraceae bacterium]|nr:hypothetical protein [Oscillospiraceae bacterium]